MIWQEWVFTAGSLVNTIALLPSVFSEHKPALPTSLLTGTMLSTYSITFTSLGLYGSAGSILVTAFLWFVLAIQVGLARWKLHR